MGLETLDEVMLKINLESFQIQFLMILEIRVGL